MKLNKFGMEDYYKFFKENYPEIKVSKQKFNDIISAYNEQLADYIIENLSHTLPFRLGKIEILKDKRKVYIDENTGKVRNTFPVDWKATNELWDNDPEAKEKKILIRYKNLHTGGYVFRIHYNVRTALFKAKTVYKFKPVRSFARALSSRINDYSKDKYDTYIK